MLNELSFRKKLTPSIKLKIFLKHTELKLLNYLTLKFFRELSIYIIMRISPVQICN